MSALEDKVITAEDVIAKNRPRERWRYQIIGYGASLSLHVLFYGSVFGFDARYFLEIAP